MTRKLVLIRHGESVWNKENLFTGWTDVDLSENGEKEADNGGALLKAEGYSFDIAFTSYLKRAIHTCNRVLAALDEEYIPVIKSWRLNERHYGDLQGKNKSDAAAKWGDDQVKIWRRSYDTPPKALDPSDERAPKNQKVYAGVSPRELPLTECLKDTVARVVPYYNDRIVPHIIKGENVLIAAHGNSLRALVKYLDNISDEEITELNIPTAVPLVYELDENMNAVKHYYLGDQEAIKAKMQAVANQGKAK